MATGIILANSFPTPQPLSSAAQSTLESILRRLHTRISHYRPLILPYFQDFDSQHTGTVSHEQFARVLTIVKTELKRDELQLLTHAYLASDISRVDYRRFLHDVDDDANERYKHREESKEELREAAATASNSILSRPQQSLQAAAPASLSAILHRMQTITAQQRKHLNDLFDDFDQLRKRRVSSQQFVRCLDVAGYRLSQHDVDTLLQHYTDSDGSVRYDAFTLDITRAFIPHQPELDPLSTAPSFSPFPLHTADAAAASLGPRLDDLLSPVDTAPLLSCMAGLSSTRRILLKPAFAAHDRAHDGCCSDSAFTAVLSSLFPSLTLSGQQMQAVARQYAKGLKGVSYVEFCAAVARLEAEYEAEQTRAAHSRETDVTDDNDGFELPAAAASSTLSATLAASASLTSSSPLASPFTSTLSLPLPTLSLLMSSLRTTLAQHRLDLNGAFDDFDRLQRGSVPASVFFRVLSAWGLRVRQQEVDLIAAGYRCEAEGRRGEVDYASFLRDLSPIPRV